MKRLVTLIVLALLMTSCGGLPPEAESTANRAAKALAAHDNEAFAKLVLPEQREGALGLDKSYPIELDKPTEELTLSDVLQVQFFTDIKAAEVSDTGANVQDETSATVILSLDYEDDAFTSKTFELRKEGDEWFIDFKETLELWHRLDAGGALSVLTLQE